MKVGLSVESFGIANNRNTSVSNFYWKVHFLHLLLSIQFAFLTRILLGSNFVSVSTYALGVFFYNLREKEGLVTLLGGVIILHSPMAVEARTQPRWKSDYCKEGTLPKCLSTERQRLKHSQL